jgi:hypothetical protein
VKLLSDPEVAKHGGIERPDTTMTFSFNYRLKFNPLDIMTQIYDKQSSINSTGRETGMEGDDIGVDGC